MIGVGIRSERQQRRLTLEQMALRTGLSKSYISQIERGLAQPSVSTLKKISSVFGISVVELFDENITSNSNPGRFSFPQNNNNKNQFTGASSANNTIEVGSYSQDIIIVRSDRRKAFKLPGSSIEYDLLTPDLNRRLEVLSVKASPGEHTGEEPLINLPGEKFGLVLNGRLEVTLRDEVFVLEKGDTIYHPADIPHSWRCLGEEPVEIIWVMTPPSF